MSAYVRTCTGLSVQGKYDKLTVCTKGSGGGGGGVQVVALSGFTLTRPLHPGARWSGALIVCLCDLISEELLNAARLQTLKVDSLKTVCKLNSLWSTTALISSFSQKMLKRSQITVFKVQCVKCGLIYDFCIGKSQTCSP